MADVARFIQDYPCQLLYALIGLGIFLVINEIRHSFEKAVLRRAFFRRAAPTVVSIPAAAPVAPPTARTGGALGSMPIIQWSGP